MVSVKVSERVEAAADAVWDLFRDFGGVQRFSAGIEKVEVTGTGIGAVRTLSCRAASRSRSGSRRSTTAAAGSSTRSWAGPSR